MRVMIAWAVLAVGCASEAERVGGATGAVNGAVDSAAMYPGVLGLFANKPKGIARCTAVLVERNLALTARHCVSTTTGGMVVCGASPLAPPIPGDDVLVTTDTVMSPDDLSRYVAAERVLVPPDGDDECGFDIAALILADEIAGVAPHEPRLDAPVATGEQVTAVGFGSDGAGGLGTRRFRGDLGVVCRGGADCTIPEVQPTEYLLEDGGVCFGDSGSPTLDADGRVLGVVSRGIDPCTAPIYSAVAAWQEWIRSVATEAATAGGYDPPAWVDSSPADAGGPPPDAGGPRPDGGTTDAGIPPGGGGGGCTVGDPAGRSWPLFLATLIGGAGRARRRRRRIGDADGARRA